MPRPHPGVATVLLGPDGQFRWHIERGGRIVERSSAVYSTRRAARRGIRRAQPTIDPHTIRFQDNSTGDPT
jgi:hypothetical protein